MKLLRSECSACRLLPSAVRVTTSIATAADGPVRRTVDPLALPQALQHCFELIAVDTVGVHQRLNDGLGQELFERWLGDAAEDRVRAPSARKHASRGMCGPVAAGVAEPMKQATSRI